MNPTLAICLSAVAWGLWWLPLRWLAGHGLTGDLVSVAIYVLGALVLAPFGLRRGWGRYVATGALVGASLAMTNAALLRGEVVRVLLLFYLAPIWATLLTALVLKQRIGLLRVGSIAVGLLGAALVLGHKSGIPLPAGPADWMGLLAGAAFAGASLLIRKDGVGSAPVQSFLTFLFAAVIGLALFFLFPVPEPFKMAQAARALPFALLVTVLWMLPQSFLFLWGAGRLDSGRVAILMLLEPMTAVISVAFMLDESLTATVLAGCALIVAAGTLEGLVPQAQ